MADRAILCEADKANRTITFRVRDGFGDGTDGIGPDQERASALKIFNDAIDVVIGQKHSVVPIEKWARLRYAHPREQ